jgi:DNA repair exonuclease SbcCD ATPase subunit
MLKEKTELVWLPKSIAAEIKEITEENKKDAIIRKYIEDSRKDIQSSVGWLSDEVVKYKAVMIDARREFKRAMDEELAANYSLWEAHEKKFIETKANVEKIQEAISPLSAELKTLENRMQQVNMYQVDKLLETLEKINSCFGSKTGDILRFLFNNYKVEK